MAWLARKTIGRTCIFDDRFWELLAFLRILLPSESLSWEFKLFFSSIRRLIRSWTSFLLEGFRLELSWRYCLHFSPCTLIESPRKPLLWLSCPLFILLFWLSPTPPFGLSIFPECFPLCEKKYPGTSFVRISYQQHLLRLWIFLHYFFSFS